MFLSVLNYTAKFGDTKFELMNKSVFTLLLLLSSFAVGAQSGNKYDLPAPPLPPGQGSAQVSGDTVLTFVDEPAEYEGGNAALIKFLGENLKYPNDAIDAEAEGKVYLRFVVHTDGNIGEITVARGVRDFPSMDKEAVRVLKLTQGKWKPGKMHGKPVASTMTLPVAFRLQ